MYLSRLVIKNFRSIKHADIKFQKGKNVIVGRNNSGKSNIVKALDIVLGENSPDYAKSQNIIENDFYIDGDERSTEMYILACLVREDGEKLNYEEINKCYGFSKLLNSKPDYINPDQDDTKYLELSFDESEFQENVEEVFSYVFEGDDVEQKKKVKYKRYIDGKNSSVAKFQDEFKDQYEFAYLFKAEITDEGVVLKHIRFLYRIDEYEGWILANKAPIRNELMQSAVIHSFRSPNSHLRLNQYSWYGKLMKALIDDHSDKDKLEEARLKMKDVAEDIFKNAQESIEKGALNVAFPNAEIHFQFNEDIKADLYKDCVIYIDDGIKSPLEDKGSGIQSATIIGLYNLYVRKNCKGGALLCVEEPELFLHPHARRVISDKLDDFTNNYENQVIITTHSTDFIRTTDQTLNIVLVKKSANSSIVKSVDVLEYKSLLLNNEYNELFFSDKVIICEGYDKYVLKWVADYLDFGCLDRNNISVISSGGKDNIPELVSLVISLGISCYVMSDFDFLLRDKDKSLCKKYNAKPHFSLESLKKIFYMQDSIYGESGEDEYKKLQQVRAYLKKNYEKEFYTIKNVDEINDKKLKEKFISYISDLRAHGVCILKGEVEDLFQDKTCLSPDGKLNLESVFTINKAINDEGTDISEILEVNEIQDFIQGLIP